MITAKSRYLRIAPRKVRLIVDTIRGKSAEQAQAILSFTNKRAWSSLLKTLNSAIANAKDKQIDASALFISKITVDEGPKYKRWRPRARGRASEVQKKTSHITIVLDEINGKKKGEVKKEQLERIDKTTKIAKSLERERQAVVKQEKPKSRPEKEMPKPTVEKGIKRVFRRKAF